MRELILHLLANNQEHVLRSSFMNCHVTGLHSVMLLDEPGKRIRLFVAAPGHGMWKNALDQWGRPAHALSLGFHGHHCNLTIVGVSGRFRNIWLDSAGPFDPRAFRLDAFKYESKLLSGRGAFEKAEEPIRSCFTRSCWFGPGESLFMPASDFHTVYVPRTETASWLVFEGADSSDYRPITYSNHDLTAFDFSALYQPMTEGQAEELVTLALAGGRSPVSMLEVA